MLGFVQLLNELRELMNEYPLVILDLGFAYALRIQIAREILKQPRQVGQALKGAVHVACIPEIIESAPDFLGVHVDTLLLILFVIVRLIGLRTTLGVVGLIIIKALHRAVKNLSA